MVNNKMFMKEHHDTLLYDKLCSDQKKLRTVNVHLDTVDLR